MKKNIKSKNSLCEDSNLLDAAMKLNSILIKGRSYYLIEKYTKRNEKTENRLLDMHCSVIIRNHGPGYIIPALVIERKECVPGMFVAQFYYNYLTLMKATISKGFEGLVELSFY